MKYGDLINFLLEYEHHQCDQVTSTCPLKNMKFDIIILNLIWQALHVKPIHMWSHYLFLNNVCLLHQSLNPNFDNTQHVQASCVRSTDMHHTMSLSIHSSHMLVIFFHLFNFYSFSNLGQYQSTTNLFLFMQNKPLLRPNRIHFTFLFLSY